LRTILASRILPLWLASPQEYSQAVLSVLNNENIKFTSEPGNTFKTRKNKSVSRRKRRVTKPRKRKNELQPAISQNWRIRTVIQPKVERRQVSSTNINSWNFSRVEDYFNDRRCIRIPSISWYIQNWILPKKSREIQESIGRYLKDGVILSK